MITKNRRDLHHSYFVKSWIIKKFGMEFVSKEKKQSGSFGGRKKQDFCFRFFLDLP